MNRRFLFANSLIFAIFFSFQTLALNCQDLFSSDQPQKRYQTQFAQPELAHDSNAKPTNSIEVLLQIQQKIREKLSQTSFSGLPKNFKFAISYSREKNIHIVSHQLNQNEHNKLINILFQVEINLHMAQIPYFLRNKYFEVSVQQSLNHSELNVVYKFANDLSFPIESQFITGFAQTRTDQIRPHHPAMSLPDDRIKHSLQNLSVTQDTLATCGLASICKVLAQKNIQLDESKMLELSQALGIKSFSEILGSTPGLELSQLASLLSNIGQQFGFRVRQVLVRNPQDVNELKRLAKLVVTNGDVDLILNYFSPAIGRPGGGHFSPIAGFNSKTNEILMSEVNSAMNPSFWTSAERLTQAMLPSESNPLGRGYIVIEWLGVGRP